MTFLLLKKKIVTPLNFFRLNIFKLWTKFGNKFGCRLKLQLHLIHFLLDVNFVKFTIGLHFLLIPFILAKFQ